ncbi:MAG TPA: tetratricopeptide repeat protein, partial [Kofleriaceae bacterium]
PAKRPATALAVLDELDQIAAAIAPELRRARPPIAPPITRTSWPGADAWVAAFAQALASPQVHVVVGDTGSGAPQLIDAAIQRWQLERAAHRNETVPQLAGTLDEVSALATHAGWIERAAKQLRQRSAICVVDLVGDPRATAVIAALARVPGPFAIVVLVDEIERVARDGVTWRRAPLLDLAGTITVATALFGVAPPRPWSEALFAVAAGAPATTIELIRALAHEPNPFATEWATRSTAALAELRKRQLSAITPPARALAFGAAAFGGRAPLGALLDPDGPARASSPLGLVDVVELERNGLAQRRGDELVIDRATVDAVDALAGEELGDIASRALARPAQSNAWTLDQVAALLAHVPIDARLADRACEVADALLSHGRGDRARSIAMLVVGAELVPRTRAATASAELAPEQAIATGRTRTRAMERDAAMAPTPAVGELPPVATRGEVVPTFGDRPTLGDRPTFGDRPTLADRPTLDLDTIRERPTLDLHGREVADPLRARPTVELDHVGDARERATRFDLGEGPTAAQIARACLIAARAAASTGAYREAIALAQHAERSGADPVTAQLLVARTCQRAGELDAAETALADLYARFPTNDEIVGTYARLLVTRSRYEDARRIATTDGVLGGLRAEAAGLAAFYLGELADADRAFAALEVTATASGDEAAIGRALSLRG